MPQLDEIWREQELMEFLGLTKDQMSGLRERGLPTIYVNLRVRLYRSDHVQEFLNGLEAVRGISKRSPRQEAHNE